MRAAEDALRILDRALAIASAGADEAEVSLGGAIVGVTRFAANGVSQCSSYDREVLAVRVAVNGRVGRSETADHSTQGIQGAARQARMLAELLPEGAAPAFADPQDYDVVDAYDPETERATELDRMAVVGRVIGAAQREGLEAFGHVSTSFGSIEAGDELRGVYAIVNSRGLSVYHAATRAELSLSMRSPEGRSGWSGARTFALGDIETDAVAAAAIEKATAAGPAVRLPPGRYAAVLEAPAVAALLEPLGLLAGAEAFAAGASFLSDRLDERITGDAITLHDDYAHPLQRGVPFDIEGVARRRVAIIEGGVARGPVYSLASAAAAGVSPTGHRVLHPVHGPVEMATNLVMAGGEASYEDLVGRVRSGVLVSRLAGVRVVDGRRLRLSAATRDGTFLLRDGALAAALEDVILDVDLLDLLGSIEEMSDAVPAGAVVAPTVRVPALAVVGAATS